MTDRDESVFGQQYKYSKEGWPFASIRPIATRIAAQTIRGVRPSATTKHALWQWQKDKLPKWLKQSQYAAMEPVLDHRLLNAVNRPNAMMVEWMLMWCTAFSIQATGKCCWWFSEAGDDIRIWPVPSNWVKRNGEDWTITMDGALDSIPVKSDNMLVFYLPDPSNPLACMSPLQAASRPILSDVAIQDSQLQGFRGGHLPTMVAIIGEKVDADGVKRRPEITPDQRLELESRLMALHGGPRNHGRIGLVDGLITDFKRLSMAPTEMDYMASSRLTKGAIQNIFGVSPVTMGELENANRASSYVADENFLCNVVNPLLEMMGQVLTAFAARSSLFAGDPLIAYYEPVVARDVELEQKDWQFAYDRAVISDDDFRIHRLGIPPKNQGGEYARISFQFVPTLVDGVPEAPPMPTLPAARAFKAVTARQWERIRSQQESVLQASLEEVFQRQVDRIVDEVANGTADAGVLLRDGETLRDLRETLVSKLRIVAEYGADIESSMLKSRVPRDRKGGVEDVLYGLSDRVHPYVEQYLKELLDQPYWQDVADGIEPKLAALLVEYQNQGMDSRSMADALRADLDELSLERSQRVARTETGGAMNSGAYAVRMELAGDGLVIGHQWNTILDQETRGADPSDSADHVVMDGQRVGINQMFDVGGEQAPFPGHFSLSAKQRSNCRCFTTAVTIFD